MVSSDPKFVIVGIAASSGENTAIEALFRGLPAPANAAFVIIAHQGQGHERELLDALPGYAEMPVHVAEHGQRIVRDCIYILPWNAIATIKNRVLKMDKPATAKAEVQKVDVFLRSLAQDQGDHAVGIILSGGDEDGALGIKAIRECGGLTIAQSGDPEMPKHSMSGGMIDIYAPADQIGARLVTFIRNLGDLPTLAVRGRTSAAGSHAAAVGLQQLERDMRDTRRRLQATIDKYVAVLGQLGRFKEELVSSSPQARFSNEEPDAFKVEMQSLNEELHTIDAELTSKVDALDNAGSDLKNLFESTNIATVFLDRKLVIRNFTPAATAFFNLRTADVGRPLPDLASSVKYPKLKEHIALVLDSGEMVEPQLPRNAEGRHFLARLLAYLDGDAQIKGVVVTMVDLTTLARAEDHQQTLISELNHRVKNMLAIVISIANHTLATTVSPEAFTTALLGRLHAMSRTYGLLARANWRDVLISDVLRVETDAFGLDRFTFTGPDVLLTPQQGLSLGMVLHELATNACKYGALSLPQGGVSINWAISGSNIHLVWNEKGGPEVVAASTEGFGFSLVRGEIAYRLGGHVEVDFQSRGLDVQIEFELDQ